MQPRRITTAGISADASSSCIPKKQPAIRPAREAYSHGVAKANLIPTVRRTVAPIRQKAGNFHQKDTAHSAVYPMIRGRQGFHCLAGESWQRVRARNRAAVPQSPGNIPFLMEFSNAFIVGHRFRRRSGSPSGGASPLTRDICSCSMESGNQCHRAGCCKNFWRDPDGCS